MMRKTNEPTTAPTPQPEATKHFNEELYLRLNPDVRLAMAAGSFSSGREHFERYGRAEGRPFLPAAMQRGRVSVSANPHKTREHVKPPACAIDSVKISASGAILVVGWVNDAQDPLDCIELYFAGWSVALDGAALARVRRPDAEAALATGAAYTYGLWGFLYAACQLQGSACNALLRFFSGQEVNVMLVAENIGDLEMRKAALEHLATAPHFGNAYFAQVTAIETSIGAQLVNFSKTLSQRALQAPYIERFGRSGRHYLGSFIVCLYGKPEYMFLQNALFSRQPGMEDYEFIYICNSPETAEPLLKEARICTHIYGIDMTVICLNANAGFGAANNFAAQYANSERLIIMNPDVFPREPALVRKHSELVESLPAAQTALFGAPLYYDDGSLMHAGMYFCADTAPNFSPGGTGQTQVLRVEHYGKGAPPDTACFLQARPVPAITGAFISTQKTWFEKLGGFSPDYIFGHYEDADLCLRSIHAGQPAWMQDIKLWHLEGKGSARQAQHEGGSAVNRWLFTKYWGNQITNGLLGPAPDHPGLTVAARA